MKTVTYKAVRDGVISRLGIDPSITMLPNQASAVAEYASTAIMDAWNFFDWPEVVLTESRTPVGNGFQQGVYTFESDFAGTTNYIGRALQGSSFADPVWRIKRIQMTVDGVFINTDTAENVAWTDRANPAVIYSETTENPEAEDFVPYILLDATGKSRIGEVQAVYDADPTGASMYNKMRYVVTDDRILLPDYTEGQVYVVFALPVPRFTSTAFSVATTYAPGDLVYYNTTGDCYEALLTTSGNLPTDAAFWYRHRIPAFLADHIKFYALAESLSEDGQMDKAQFQFVRAEGVLLKAMDDAWLRKGAVRRYTATFR